MEDEFYMIQIPANVKLRMEVINGVGLQELTQTIVAGIISAIIAYITYQIFHNYLVSIGIFLGVTSITFLLVMKDKNNSSVAGIIGNIIRFYKGQRFYKYKLHNLNYEDGGK